jgi:hypothetical protein
MINNCKEKFIISAGIMMMIGKKGQTFFPFWNLHISLRVHRVKRKGIAFYFGLKGIVF